MGRYKTFGGHIRLLGGGQHTAERSGDVGGAERRRRRSGAETVLLRCGFLGGCGDDRHG